MRHAISIGLLTGLFAAGSVYAGGAECAAAAAKAAEAKTCCTEATEGCKGCCTHTAQECRDQMTAMFKDRGWAGLELSMDDETGALTVSRVEPKSPAMQAGFLEGDVLVAMNGVRLGQENQEKVYSAKDKLVVGARVTYTVERAGEKRDLPVVLAQMAEQVLQAWIERHLIEGHPSEMAKN